MPTHVVAAYPISPQTRIVEGLSRLVKPGGLEGCRYLNVESEFAALSVLIGASAAGSRAFAGELADALGRWAPSLGRSCRSVSSAGWSAG